MRTLSRAIVLLLLVSCQQPPAENVNTAAELLITIKRNYSPRPSAENVTVSLTWSAVIQHLPQLETNDFKIIDQHFGKEVSAQKIDTDGDGQTDAIRADAVFASGEPIFTWKLIPTPDEASAPVATEEDVQNDSLEISLLLPYQTFVGGDTVRDWASKIFETSLETYPDPADFTIISPGEWNYEHGFFLNAGFELWKRKKNERYYNYIKSWVDRFLTEEGRLKEEDYDVSKYRLDDILPGRLCIFLFQETGDERYKTAAFQLREHLEHQPRTKEGGYWHKEIYPSQMWLDGIYMADVFSTQFASVFNEPELFDEAALQIKLISQHTKDSVTGLMYHGWDESKNPVWAHPVKGTSPEFWGRAMGWYVMALIDCLDYIPEDHPDRAAIVSIFQDLCKSLAGYQDKDSRLWYQVIDKGDRPDNWIETSCSAMFAYGFAKGHNKGLLDRSYFDRAKEAFNSLINNYTYYDDEGKICLNQTVKVGTLNTKNSDGSYEYYVGSERRSNDYKGLSALLYASMELADENTIP